MAANAADIGQDLLAVPFPEMVERLATSIASAQLELDLKSVQIAQLMAGQDLEIDGPDGEKREIKAQLVKFGDDENLSLLELGFMPSFYQFVDTIIEVKMSISMTSETTSKRSSTTAKASAGWGSVSVSTVSASFSQKYSYHAEGASLLRTKLVPVPAPAVLEERIRLLLEEKKSG